jgi:hypothetical protein
MPPCSLLLIFVVEVVEVVGRPSWGAPEGATVPSEQLQSLEGVRPVEVTGSGVSRSLKRGRRSCRVPGGLVGVPHPWVLPPLAGDGSALCLCVCAAVVVPREM